MFHSYVEYYSEIFCHTFFPCHMFNINIAGEHLCEWILVYFTRTQRPFEITKKSVPLPATQLSVSIRGRVCQLLNQHVWSLHFAKLGGVKIYNSVITLTTHTFVFRPSCYYWSQVVNSTCFETLERQNVYIEFCESEIHKLKWGK